MNNLQPKTTIPPMKQGDIDKVRELEDFLLSFPQVDLVHTHTLHGCVYTRTVFLPAETIITGAHIIVPTTLIVSGKVVAYFGDRSVTIEGYEVFTAAPGRKVGFAAVADTYLTMIYATDAMTVEEAENQFTDESDRLMTRKGQ